MHSSPALANFTRRIPLLAQTVAEIEAADLLAEQLAGRACLLCGDRRQPLTPLPVSTPSGQPCLCPRCEALPSDQLFAQVSTRMLAATTNRPA